MGVWVPEEAAFDLCRAVLRLFRDEGARGDRQKVWLSPTLTLTLTLDEP